MNHKFSVWMIESLCIFFNVKEKDPALDYVKGLFEKDQWDVTVHPCDHGDGQVMMMVTANLIALKISAERFNLRKKCNSVPPFQVC